MAKAIPPPSPLRCMAKAIPPRGVWQGDTPPPHVTDGHGPGHGLARPLYASICTPAMCPYTAGVRLYMPVPAPVLADQDCRWAWPWSRTGTTKRGTCACTPCAPWLRWSPLHLGNIPSMPPRQVPKWPPARLHSGRLLACTVAACSPAQWSAAASIYALVNALICRVRGE